MSKMSMFTAYFSLDVTFSKSEVKSVAIIHLTITYVLG